MSIHDWGHGESDVQSAGREELERDSDLREWEAEAEADRLGRDDPMVSHVDKIAALVVLRNALSQRVAFLVAEAHGWQPRLQAAIEERDEAIRLLREVVKADQQDAQMGYPIPGDSCMGAFIRLVLMEYLDGKEPS